VDCLNLVRIKLTVVLLCKHCEYFCHVLYKHTASAMLRSSKQVNKIPPHADGDFTSQYQNYLRRIVRKRRKGMSNLLKLERVK